MDISTKHKLTFASSFACLLGLVLNPVQGQTTLQEVFKIEADSGELSWFKSDNNTRGMTVNPKGSILVADRTPTNAVYKLDPFTGRQIGELDTATVSEGTFPVNKITSTAYGRIYLCNLASATSTFKVYYYSNENSQPITVYREKSVSSRWGDDLAVIGSGTRTTLGVLGSDTTDMMILTDRDGDGQFTSRIVTPTDPAINGSTNIVFDLNQRYCWIMQSTGAPSLAYQYDILTGENTTRSDYSDTSRGPLALSQVGESTLFSMGAGWNKDGKDALRGYILDLDYSDFPLYQTGNLGASSGTNSNTNGAGDVILDADRSMGYFLMTNNTISAWKLP